MYKLLLVTDREEVLEAFNQVPNWEFNGFRRPHVRKDTEGAKESLKKHHADGIAIAVSPAEEAKLLEYLQQEYPMVPIFEAGNTPEEVQGYLMELNGTLNRIRADLSNDSYDEKQMMIRARRHFFRKLVSGEKISSGVLYRTMCLLRSRMDPDRPCLVMMLARTSMEDDELMDGWEDSDHLLEYGLFQSFGGDVNGFHVLPLVSREGRIFVLAAPLRGEESDTDPEKMTSMLNSCVTEGIRHAEEYQGLRLRISAIDVYPCLYALCYDYEHQKN